MSQKYYLSRRMLLIYLDVIMALLKASLYPVEIIF